jgi:hypothetical protein
MRALVLGSAVWVAVSSGACNKSASTSAPPPSGSPTPGGTEQLPGHSGEEPSNASPLQASGHLLIPKQRMAELAAKVSGNAPEWGRLKQNVDENLARPDTNRGSAENVAVVYLLTRDKRYADGALAWARHSMRDDVRSDSYLGFGEHMRAVAIVLNYCAPALDAGAKKELADYLAQWTQELWFANKGSGWGIADPGNNYHMAFLEGTAFAAWALRAAGDARAGRFLELLTEKIERPNGVLAYLNTRAKGGSWNEGVNYGQRSKQRLFAALAVIASMGGTNYFKRSRFFAEAIYHALYEVQPGGGFLHPGGDVARESSMAVTPYDRDYVQLATFWIEDATARGYGQYYLSQIAPTYLSDKTVNWRGALYKDVLFGLPIAPTPPTRLPLSYHAAGNGWINLRSGWDARATSLTISAASTLDQSHAHVDVGSFTIWKDGWQAPDAVSYSRSGLLWDAGSHNMVHVRGHGRFDAKVRGLVHFADEREVAYVSVDASGLHRHRPSGTATPMLEEYTRELVYLRPDTLVVYDRVAPKAAGTIYDWRMHFGVRPTQANQRLTAQNGGGAVALTMLQGNNPTVVEDTDLPEGGSRGFRVEVAPADPARGRFLAVVQVAGGAPPTLAAERITSRAPIDGAVVADEVVVFSAQPMGKPAPLGFSYTVPGTGRRTHTLVDMAGSCDISAARTGNTTTITVAAGAKHKASAQGMIRFTE